MTQINQIQKRKLLILPGLLKRQIVVLKLPSISCLATNAALTAVKNKIPDVSSLAKKTDYNDKISEIEKKNLLS